MFIQGCEASTFNSAAAELIKKTLFFLRCSVTGGGWGFPRECPPRCPIQPGGSPVTICLPRLCPAGVRFAPLLQALPCCCVLRPAAMGYALLPSLSVVAGCLGNGRLRQQWACSSVEADCLTKGGRPSPTELHRPGFSCACTQSTWNCRFVCPTALPQMLSPWNLLG